MSYKILPPKSTKFIPSSFATISNYCVFDIQGITDVPKVNIIIQIITRVSVITLSLFS